MIQPLEVAQLIIIGHGLRTGASKKHYSIRWSLASVAYPWTDAADHRCSLTGHRVIPLFTPSILSSRQTRNGTSSPRLYAVPPELFDGSFLDIRGTHTWQYTLLAQKLSRPASSSVGGLDEVSTLPTTLRTHENQTVVYYP